jgi:hypothetical protein
MKIIFSILFLVCALFIYQFNAIQLWLLERNYSWTMAKALPYIFAVIIGILLAYTFAKGFKLKSKVLKFGVVTSLFALPFALVFALNPIYDGDFSSQGVDVASSKVTTDSKYNLMVITIPDCPFCLESIARLKMIKKQHPEAQILFSVCSSDTSKLELYKEQIAGAFDIELAAQLEESVKLANGSFPTFFRVEKGVPVYKWSNNQFGAGAIDDFIGGL